MSLPAAGRARKSRSPSSATTGRSARLNLESDQLSAFDENDLDELKFFAEAAAISIEKALLHRQLLEKKLIDKQLQLAREMQSRLFPGESPQIEGYDIAGICLPATEIGGDYYDFIKLPRVGLGVAVADVSGHGIPSALVMTAFRGLLRMHTRGRLGPAKIARAVNRLLPEFTADSDFVTVVYLVLYPEDDEFTYICCGQQPPLFLHSDGSLENLDVHGPALGVFKQVHYATDHLSISSGDILAIYTDGVVELANQAGVEFGTERLAASIKQGRELPAAELISANHPGNPPILRLAQFPGRFYTGDHQATLMLLYLSEFVGELIFVKFSTPFRHLSIGNIGEMKCLRGQGPRKHFISPHFHELRGKRRQWIGLRQQTLFHS